MKKQLFTGFLLILAAFAAAQTGKVRDDLSMSSKIILFSTFYMEVAMITLGGCSLAKCF